MADSNDTIDENYDVAAGVISTLGIALVTKDSRMIGKVMRDITKFYEDDPENALEFFKVVAIMCANHSVELFELQNPGWVKRLQRDARNANKGGSN